MNGTSKLLQASTWGTPPFFFFEVNKSRPTLIILLKKQKLLTSEMGEREYTKYFVSA